ncbi:MAG: hybrid sensor histidine kinase/response regulator [Ignavibacteria bacterium]
MTSDDNINSILIVDDQPHNIQLIGTLLRKYYNLYVADNGESAIKIAVDKKPDLILLDIMMPVLSGFDVCKILKSNIDTQNIPIVFLTAKNEAEDIVTGFKLGAVDYITKPFKRDEVLIRVSTHIKLKEAENELKRKNSELESLNTELIVSKNLIEKSAQELELLNHEKDKFFSIIAHDLKNPLAGFVGLTEMVSFRIEKFSTDELKHYLDLMHNSAGQLNELLSNLLEWARLQMGNIEFKPDSNNLFDLVEKIVGLQNSNITAKSINVSVKMPSNLGFVFDLYMLETVLRNLITNAVKFTKENGSVVIAANMINNNIVISVKDSGIGMPPPLAKKIFSLKEVVSRKGTSGEASTGLGLILCKSFVEKNNGSIWFETEAGMGSTFFVSLPYIRQ